MNDRHEDLIRDVPLLARLEEEEIRALASNGHVHNYTNGSALFHEGDPGDSLYIVIEGGVRIVVASPKGEEATVALLGPGECVGDLALLDGKPRSASAEAAVLYDAWAARASASLVTSSPKMSSTPPKPRSRARSRRVTASA
ncbi:MAG: cyclic nucleotide-binding domain-containing protein, partial [Chloroflexi bacterium]|nr:cyclic nucleotide-binding domain-containing protein [Chloroflexota bacterium]